MPHNKLTPLLFLYFAALFVGLWKCYHDPRWIHKTIVEIRRNHTKEVSSITSDKWIVVTSVNSPSEDVKRLAELKDWNLVVVADKKTPEATWQPLLDQVHFLSVSFQEQLASELPSVGRLPYKSYTRKNIGYLYAISHGANWIYDTDDDNKPYGPGLDGFHYEHDNEGVRIAADPKKAHTKLFNPYRFFGRKDMWPRGFPLNSIYNDRNASEFGQMKLCWKMRTSAVQQGLVHHDPDVDAIFRLLNADPETGLNDGFNKFAPPITLAPGVYAPWNSQNTLFNRRAFHTMFLPTTVSFRTTDIWRSFFSQKLLQLTGDTVSFVPPNAVQYRNAHNFLDDFEDEGSVYEFSGNIIEFLDEWKCTKQSVDECTIQLAVQFAVNGYWKDDDVKLLEAWIQDLLTVGYEFPALEEADESRYRTDEYTELKRNCRQISLQFDEQVPDKLDNLQDVVDWCNKSDKFHGFNVSADRLMGPTKLKQKHTENVNKVIIVTNNYPWNDTIGHYQRLYHSFFGVVIFCGTIPTEFSDTSFAPIQKPFHYINMSEVEMEKGYFAYHCMTLAKKMHLQNVEDDSNYNFWLPLNSSVVTVSDLAEGNERWTWNWGENSKYGDLAADRIFAYVWNTKNEKVKKVWDKFDGMVRTMRKHSAVEEMNHHHGRAISDFFYLPSKHLELFADLMTIFYKFQLFHEIAIGKFIKAVPKELCTKCESSYLWWDDRKNASIRYTNERMFMHPWKPSTFITNMTERAGYCNTYINNYSNYIFGS